MKILHLGPLNVKTGGPTLSTYLAVKGIERQGQDSAILTMPLAPGDKWYAEDIKLYLTNNYTIPHYGYIPGFQKTLAEIPSYDVIHLQGLWMHLFHGGAVYARRNKVPYVISLRGNLYPQALHRNRLLKKVFRNLFQDKDLCRAACIHATCEDELRYYRKLGFANPVAVIPNPISIDDVIDRPIPNKEEFTIGYLGRLHPRKRVERLIYAVDFLRNKNLTVKLKIIGSDDKEYEEFLKNEVKRLKLDCVEFTGFLVGDAKDEAISGLSVLACAADFENFGNIVTEALVRGVPVMATKGMPWRSLEEYECGWWVENDQETINNTLLKLSGLGEAKLREMGLNGKKMIREHYSVDAVGKQFVEMYHWILNGGKAPYFIDVVK